MKRPALTVVLLWLWSHQSYIGGRLEQWDSWDRWVSLGSKAGHAPGPPVRLAAWSVPSLRDQSAAAYDFVVRNPSYLWLPDRHLGVAATLSLDFCDYQAFVCG